MTDEKLLEVIGKNVEEVRVDLKEVRADISRIQQESNCYQNTTRISELWDEKNISNGMAKLKEAWTQRYRSPIITGIIVSITHVILYYVLFSG